ncbi:hypothetical protein E3Q00_02335 [Wallemia mellicola]|nr:hypothetical protein E3Q00_02335 [Wallemia mellicola]
MVSLWAPGQYDFSVGCSGATSMTSLSSQDEYAEVELLEQNLLKVKNLTTSMSSILQNLDARLARLDNSVIPLQSSTNGLDVLSNNIQSALNLVDNDQRQSTIAREDETVINDGADPSDIRPYLKVVSNLSSQLEYLKHSQWSSSRDSIREITGMVEKGVRSLLRVFEGWVRDVSKPVDAEKCLSKGFADFPDIPQHAMTRLTAFVEAVSPIIKTLPPPSYTHPSIIYASERARYFNVSLQPFYKQAESSLNSYAKSGPLGASIYAKGSQRVTALINGATALADVEWQSATALFGQNGDANKPFLTAVAPAITLLQSATSNVFSLAKSNPLRHIFAVLDLLDTLAPFAEKWERSITRRSTQSSKNEVTALVENARSITLRSFPDIIKYIKSHTGEEKHSTSVSNVTNDTVTYLKEILIYGDTVERNLKRLGDGGWNVSSKVMRNVPTDGETLLERYLRDVLFSLISSLTRVKSSAYSSIYVLNNLSLLRRDLIEACEPVSLDPSKTDSPSNRDIGDLLGEPAEDELNAAFRSARISYLDTVWKPALVALTSDELSTTSQGPHVPTALGGSAEKKQLIKDKFSRFNDAFAALEKLHNRHPVGKRDSQLSTRLNKEAKAMILPPYATLWGKNQSGDFAKTPSKYMKLLRPAACSHSLSRLAVDAFIANHRGYRGLRVGVDASIWLIHSQTAPGGLNPALRTLFFKLCNLLSLPILPLFVFDGPKRPKMKRGKQVRGAQPRGLKDFIKLIDAFGFEYHNAPGEAEAELARLSKAGIIDVVLSDDVDSLLFGGVKILRKKSWSLGLSGNSKSQADLHNINNDDSLAADDHRIETYTLDDICRHDETGVTPNGLILVALLAGGDYHPAGVQSCGTKNAFGLARAGFGDKLIEGVRTLQRDQLDSFLTNWREELKEELANNSSGYLSSKRPSVATSITTSFPDLDVLERYINPLTTESIDCEQKYKESLNNIKYNKEPNIAELARFCEEYFEWGEKSRIIAKFRNSVWDGIYIRALRASTVSLDGGQHGEFNDEVSSQFIKIHQTRNKSKYEKYMEYRLSINPSPYVDVVDEAVTGDMKALREARRRNDPALRDLRNALPDEQSASGTTMEDLTHATDASTSTTTGRSKQVDQHSALRIWIPSQILKAALLNETDAFDKGLTRKDSNVATRVTMMAPSRKPAPVIREETIIDEASAEATSTRRTRTVDSISSTSRGGGRARGRGNTKKSNTLTRNATVDDFVDFTDTANPILIPSPKRNQRKTQTRRKTSGSKRAVDNRSTDDLETHSQSPAKRVSGGREIVVPSSDVLHGARSPTPTLDQSPPPSIHKSLTPTYTTPRKYSLTTPLEPSLSPPSPSALIRGEKERHSINETISIDDDDNSPVSVVRRADIPNSPISISSDDNTSTPRPTIKKIQKVKPKTLTSIFGVTKPQQTKNKKRENITNSNITNDVIDLT